jgi:hypothetical protein
MQFIHKLSEYTKPFVADLIKAGKLHVKIDGRPVDLQYKIVGDGWWSELILNCLSESDRKELIDSEVTAMKQRYGERRKQEEQALEAEFDSDGVQGININVWDEYAGDETYIYIESGSLPLFFQQNILSALKAYIPEQIKSDLRLYDSSKVYPGLVGSEHEYSLFFSVANIY